MKAHPIVAHLLRAEDILNFLNNGVVWLRVQKI